MKDENQQPELQAGETPAPRDERSDKALLCGVALLLALAFLAVRFAVPWYRQEKAREHFEAIRASVVSRKPARWLQFVAGEKIAAKICNTVLEVHLNVTYSEDEDLIPLRDLPDLETLCLTATNVTDAGLVYLRDLHRLRSLDLSQTQVTDAGLIHIRALRRLEFLDLNTEGITLNAPAQLRSLTSLRELAMLGRSLSNDNILELRGLTHLEKLEIRGNSYLTLNGAESLREHIPGLSFYW